MAITKSAQKAIGVAKRRRAFNLDRKSNLQKAIKDLKKAIKSGKKSEAESLLVNAYKQLDKAAKTHVIKKGNASRRKSRLAKQIQKIK